ncbi:MAG: four helix bundle protein [Armatimonadetes bacterium]|nr:four helix bundle protein [Armatimonadota bacterium]
MTRNVVQEKSFKFALEIIRLYCELRDEREYVVSKQLLRSGTSIGANVEEASSAQSRKDFVSKMSIALKEARETKYWLRLLQESDLTTLAVSTELTRVDELLRILASIVKTTKEHPAQGPILNS